LVGRFDDGLQFAHGIARRQPLRARLVQQIKDRPFDDGMQGFQVRVENGRGSRVTACISVDPPTEVSAD
jgi:hypothetical protein